MLPRAIHLPELQKRIKYQHLTWWDGGLEPFSFQWINKLFDRLVSAGDSKQARQEVWQSAATMLLEADVLLPRVRYEFACIPVEVKVTYNAGNILGLQMYGKRLSDDTNYDAASLTEALPANYTVDMLKEDQVYWFHFTKSEVQKMDLAFLKLEDWTLLYRLQIPTWSENASIVDTVLRLAEGARVPRDVIGLPDETSVVPVAPKTAREQIVDFIEERGQVTTGDILAQKFCADGVAKKRLRAMVNEKKIIKIKHGVYASTSRTLLEK